MPDLPRLPSPPPITVTVARDRTSESRADGGFLNVRRLDLVVRRADGTVSDEFAYDVMERRAIDAVAIVAYARPGTVRREGEPGAGAIRAEPEVYLRTAARVPLMLREGFGVAEGNMWELPAGLVDVGESPRDAAVRELEEELGFRVEARALDPLGGWVWPVPGFIAERQFYFCVDVSDTRRATPTEDGSPLEQGASIERFPLSTLLAQCRAGHLHDAKTELALRRFAERA